jgi:hypothetical protein
MKPGDEGKSEVSVYLFHATASANEVLGMFGLNIRESF